MINNLINGFVQAILIGIIFGVVVDRWLIPLLQRWLDRIERWRARDRYQATQIPDPPQEFNKYRLGNIEIPVMNLMGSPLTPFSVDEVKTTYEPLVDHQQPDYPAHLSDAKPYLLEEYFRKFNIRSQHDREVPRLVGCDQAGESQDDKRGGLTLHFALTTFHNLITTNRSLDYKVIPETGPIARFTKNQTIRTAYVKIPRSRYLDSLASSVLSNALSSSIVVISRNLYQTPKDQVLIRLRSNSVAFFRNYYQVSAAGLMSTAHRDESRNLSPFITAVEEANQEIADKLKLASSDFKLIGIAVNWEDLDLHAYGYAETGLAVQDLLGDFRRDAYEGGVEAISFDPKSILSHIAHNKWEPVSVLAMCAALLVFFPRTEVEKIAGTIPAKHFREFYER